MSRFMEKIVLLLAQKLKVSHMYIKLAIWKVVHEVPSRVGNIHLSGDELEVCFSKWYQVASLRQQWFICRKPLRVNSTCLWLIFLSRFNLKKKQFIKNINASNWQTQDPIEVSQEQVQNVWTWGSWAKRRESMRLFRLFIKNIGCTENCFETTAVSFDYLTNVFRTFLQT